MVRDGFKGGYMYAKLENNILHCAPDKVQYAGNTIFNPPSNILLELGYLPVIYTDMPTDIVNGKHYDQYWECTNTEIVQMWELVDNPIMPEQELTISDLEQAIMEVINNA